MVELKLRTHPDVLFPSANHIQLIINAKNSDGPVWTEADLYVPEDLSLKPNSSLKRGRIRIGILNNSSLEKDVRIYNLKARPKMYTCSVTVFAFNQEGIIKKRIEKSVDIRCEKKKDASY